MSVNPKYLKGLSIKEKIDKKKNIKETKQSTFTQQIKKKYPDIKPNTKDFENKTGIPLKAQREIVDRGKAAFLTSGSRASVSSPTQWSYARLYAFYIKSIKGTLNFDKDIVRKYKIKFKK